MWTDKPIAQKKNSDCLRGVCTQAKGLASVFTAELFLTAKMSDRRTEKRWDVCLDAVWEGESGKYGARVTDLSEGGCYIDTLCEATVGEILNFKVNLHTGEWLNLTGEVAHVTPALGFGVRFINLNETELKKLQSLIEEHPGGDDPVSAILSF